MLTQTDQKHWSPIPEVAIFVASKIKEGAKVLELGPGTVPFHRSTQFVDMVPAENTVVCDIQKEKLPFPDKSFDFIYCRHTVEDLPLPSMALNEMSRVGKAGFIETPSPVAEICRGIDGGSPPWRGYAHHNWTVWSHDGTLCLLRKYPAIEYAQFSDENFFANALRSSPIFWNTYHLWEGEIRWSIQEPGNFSTGYSNKLAVAANEGMENAKAFLADMVSNRIVDAV